MLNKDTISSIIERKKVCHPEDHNQFELLNIELIEALGDDQNEIMDYLESCSDDELLWLSEAFEDLYEKFMNDEMYDFLQKLYEKTK